MVLRKQKRLQGLKENFLQTFLLIARLKQFQYLWSVADGIDFKSRAFDGRE
jgi:hypothetical protein